MPKNKGKGGKNRRRGKNENDNEKRELTFKEDGQEYAQVVKMLGYVLRPFYRFSCVCSYCQTPLDSDRLGLHVVERLAPRARTQRCNAGIEFDKQRITMDKKTEYTKR